MNMTDKLNDTLVDPVTGLTYRVREAQAGQGKAPCLVLLHGVGSNESGFIDLARQLDPRLTVVLARGPLTLGSQQFAWFQVNFAANGPAINPVQAETARTTLIDFIGQLPQLHDIDPARIWVAGFSQGGIMSASVALTEPARVAGFGILSGRILPEVLPLVKASPALASLPAFVSHGVQDAVLGIHFAHHAKQVLDGLGLPLSYHEYQGGHSLNQAMVRDFSAWLDAQLNSPIASKN
jgi:phospholipase/carboxylesterase